MANTGVPVQRENLYNNDLHLFHATCMKYVPTTWRILGSPLLPLAPLSLVGF